MKEFFQKYQTSLPLFIMLSLFGAMGLMAWFGIVPFHQMILEKADGIQEYYATRENREMQKQKLPELEGQFLSIEKDEKALDILLSEEAVVDFVKTLEGLAAESHVVVTIRAAGSNVIEEKKNLKIPVKKGAPAETVDLSKAPATLIDTLPIERFVHITVTTQGEYRDIVTFLHKMETLPLGIDVLSVSMKIRNAEEKTERPDNPGLNPFLILSGNDTAVQGQAEAQAVPQPQGSVEASFDTVVYLDK
jgi:hypothetical protein